MVQWHSRQVRFTTACAQLFGKTQYRISHNCTQWINFLFVCHRIFTLSDLTLLEVCQQLDLPLQRIYDFYQLKLPKKRNMKVALIFILIFIVVFIFSEALAGKWIWLSISYSYYLLAARKKQTTIPHIWFFYRLFFVGRYHNYKIGRNYYI